MIRRDGRGKDDLEIDPAESPGPMFREASWEEALDAAAAGLARIRDATAAAALAGFGSAKGSNEEAYLFQKLVRTGFGTNNVDHCTRLCHASSVAALMEGIGSGAVTAPFTNAPTRTCIIVIGAAPGAEPPGRGDLPQERGQGGQDQADRHGPARPGLSARDPHAAVQARPGRGAA